MSMPRPARMCPESLDDGVSDIIADDEDSSNAVWPFSVQCNSPNSALDLSCSPISERNFGKFCEKKRLLSPKKNQKIPSLRPGPRVWWQRQHRIPVSFMPDLASVAPQPIPAAKMVSRLVENQREKFESDAVFRRLSRESEVRYAGLPIERPIEQRRRQFETDVNNGFLVVSFLSSGTHIMLTFRNPRNVPEIPAAHDRDLSVAEIRNGQLFIQSKMMLNGVCVIWNGHIDMETLDGLGRLEFDTAAAEAEVGRGQVGAQRRQ